MKLISIVTPCYNEEGNVGELCARVRTIFEASGRYSYEHIFIDNCSKDGTVKTLKEIAARDKHVKIIVNTKNFGTSRSPVYGLYQARGDAIVPLVADLQDPPELITEFLAKWEEGFKIVVAVKKKSIESVVMRLLRRAYYHLISYLSEDAHQIKDFSSYGLYDKEVIGLIRSTGDHDPYFRGLICDMGFDIAQIGYTRLARSRGRSKNSLYDLYAHAMNGITCHSRMPLRFATFLGFVIALVSLFVAACYGVYKLIFWQNFSVGIAPIVTGIFFFSGVQLIFLGIIGEYIGAIHGRMYQRWMVIEKERINFDQE
jgi:polyisoprenyl-phosphate glycosyltransferase